MTLSLRSPVAIGRAGCPGEDVCGSHVRRATCPSSWGGPGPVCEAPHRPLRIVYAVADGHYLAEDAGRAQVSLPELNSPLQ